MREPRKRQQEAAAARNYVAPVERSANIFDMPLDEFQGALVELRSQGLSQDRIDDLMRQYRAQASPFAGINEAATASQGAIADAGRSTVAGGLLSKPEGATGMDAVRGLQFEGMNGLLGALSGAGQAVDAPMAAYQNLIPQGDMALEALGTAGAAMTGGGAVLRPSSSLGMGGRVVNGDFGENWSDAYHWTRSQEPFDQFDPDKSTSAMSQLGPHVGTQSAAQARTLAFPNESGTMMSLRANTEKPFLNPRTNEPWSEIGLESFISAFADEQGINRRDAAPMMRRMLAAEGYTDIPYINDIEDAGSISNIMLVDRPSGSDAVLRRSDAAFNPARRTDPNLLAANANTQGGLLATAASDTLNPSEQMARRILDMRAAGRAGEVTDEMMAAADPQYMFNNTPLPMDEASRLARAGEAYAQAAEQAAESYDNVGIRTVEDPAFLTTESVRWDDGNRIPDEFLGGTSATDAASPTAFTAHPNTGVSGNAPQGTYYGDYSGILQSNRSSMGEDSGEIVMQNPELAFARSRFARFDPEFAHLANLNAANIDPMTGLFGAMAAEEQRRRRNAP